MNVLPHTANGEQRIGAAIARRVSFERISRRFGDLSAVHEVDLEIAAGEIVCLLGPSGCGKTTLLRIAAGLERQNSGRVLIDGQEIAGPTRFLPPEERGVGLMFQDYALFPHLTVLENVGFGLIGLDRRRRAEHARAALARVGLAHLAHAYPDTLSGGEQQRTALARVVAPRPPVLLMDEPFSGLDRGLRESVRYDTLAVLKEIGASSILVTHDPEEAMLLADRIALMRAGRLVQVGTPDDLYLRPVDAEAMRFFSEVSAFVGEVRAGVVETPLGPVAAADMGEGSQVEVLVRESGLAPVEASRGTPARVTSVRFAGEVSRIEARIDAGGEVVRLRIPGSTVLAAGAQIGVVLDPAMTHVFARTG